jgi:hypothetical protein
MLSRRVTISNIAILSFIIFAINQILLNTGISWYFTKSYLDDLLCFPIILFIIQFIHRKSIKGFKLPLQHIILCVVLFSVFFELILPLISIKFTSDRFDVIFYLIGATIFYLINSKQSRVTG